MDMHENSEAFIRLVRDTAQSMDLPLVYIEKDYWLTRALKHLSESDRADSVVFKGGTSLTKAHRIADRFSEDIDLAILPKINTDGAAKRLLRRVEKAANQGLAPIEDDDREIKSSRFRKTVYRYPRIIMGAFGDATPDLLIEVNTFVRPEPFERMRLRAFVADTLAEQGREDEIAGYGLEGFFINVLSVERTLVEKTLAVIKHSYHSDPVSSLSDRFRHLYDICMILRREEHKRFVRSEEEFSALLRRCVADEVAMGSRRTEWLERPLHEAPLFPGFADWREPLEEACKGGFAQLVYGGLPEIDEIGAALALLRDALREAGGGP